MAAWSRRVINLRDPELQARELMSIIDRIDSPPDPVITVADVWKASPERFRQDEVQTVRVLLASFATNYDPPNSKATSTNREILMIQRGLDNDDHQTRQKVAATAFARLAKAI